jgi:hypothetical protein
VAIGGLEPSRPHDYMRYAVEVTKDSTSWYKCRKFIGLDLDLESVYFHPWK